MLLNVLSSLNYFFSSFTSNFIVLLFLCLFGMGKDLVVPQGNNLTVPISQFGDEEQKHVLGFGE